MRRTLLIIICLLCFICLTAYQLHIAPKSMETADGNSMGVILILEHRDASGRLIERRVKTGDLILENYARFLSTMLGGKKQIRNTEGSWKTITTDTLSTVSSSSHILLGNGTASATLEDYAMASEIAQAKVGSIGVTVSGNKVNATLSASFTFTASYTIREVGLRGRIWYSDSNACYFLICRDDISSDPISVEDGDTLTVTYVFMLN